LNYLGYLYVEENRNLETAETMIRKALELDSDNGAYIDSLGWLYFKRGKIKEALKELEKASALLADPVIYEHLGDAYFKTKELEKARANWQESLKLDPHQDKVKKKIEGLK
jgi:Flp pilus assembly protein TadD